MKKANGLEALKLLLEGEILESGERYYRYSTEKNEVQYSDYNKNSWKQSNFTINDFLNVRRAFNVIDDWSGFY